jgi:F-type H+-transporting ATPase subunit gamma
MSGALKEVRDRISSVKNTQQITKAMKMVSASKLRKAQQAITMMRPYADRLDHMLKNILSNLEGDAGTIYGVEREINKVLIVVITSNRGLCGAFNTNILKQVKVLLEEKYSSQAAAGNVDFVYAGKKGFDFLGKRNPNSQHNSDNLEIVNKPDFEEISVLADELMEKFRDGDYDRIDIVYSKFKNAATQFPIAVQFLPVPKVDKVENDKKPELKADYIFEPSKVELLKDLVPSILQTSFHKYILDNVASEHGARMTAMDKATENAQDMLNDLKKTYNKARQEAITKELAEIVGGAAALEG